MKLVLSALAVLVVGQVAVSVQTSPGGLVGRVGDEDGALPGVSVLVSSPALSAPRRTASSEAGQFRLNDLPAGEYQVQLSMPGYRITTGSVTVRPGAVSAITFQLPVGSVAEQIYVRSSLPMPATPVLPASPTLPIRIGGAIRPPRRIQGATPAYPADAQAAGVEGQVRIEAVIDATGAVTSARVRQGVPLLDAAALDAVRSWQYTPTLLNGKPVDVTMTVTVSFTR